MHTLGAVKGNWVRAITGEEGVGQITYLIGNCCVMGSDEEASDPLAIAVLSGDIPACVALPACVLMSMAAVLSRSR